MSADAALTSPAGAVEVVFLCLPTPMGVGGVADLTAVECVVEEVRDQLPPGRRGQQVDGARRHRPRTAELIGRDDVAVVSNPEFLREGSAVHDFLNPDRIVVGSDTRTPRSGWRRSTPGSEHRRC